MKLTASGCRLRQSRLLNEMARLGLSAAVLGYPKHVLYLTGYQTNRLHRSAVVLREDGHCTLFSASAEEGLAIDEHIPYESNFLATLRMDQSQVVAAKVREKFPRLRNVGLDKGESNGCLAEIAERISDLGPTMLQLRRCKDHDELAILEKGVEITHAVYARARQIVQPGTTELEIFGELRRAAMLAAGEDLQSFGNDFQCGTPGGPPRNRKIQAGELYILDIGPEFSAYHADNCRTFSVDRKPTREQVSAWQAIVDVLHKVEEWVKPDVSCKEVYERAKQMLDQHKPGAFFHHLGHGVGLSPHEIPNLNPFWDHHFKVGDCFTVEPGLYYTEIAGGIRLEENYLVTERGVRRLSYFPLEL